MYLTIIRYSTTDESTLGALLVNGNFACYTLEDPYHKQKIANHTRIPGGIYDIEFFYAGKLHKLYGENYPGIHRGMLYIPRVPGFDGIMIHIGNTATDTSGCILLGDKANNNMLGAGNIENSRSAYIRVYPRIAGIIAKGEKVRLLIGEPQELIKFEPFREGSYE